MNKIILSIGLAITSILPSFSAPFSLLDYTNNASSTTQIGRTNQLSGPGVGLTLPTKEWFFQAGIITNFITGQPSTAWSTNGITNSISYILDWSPDDITWFAWYTNNPSSTNGVIDDKTITPPLQPIYYRARVVVTNPIPSAIWMK